MLLHITPNGEPIPLRFFDLAAARFATCAEVERHSERIDDMLTGWDIVLLKDGVKYGPRYGYVALLDKMSDGCFAAVPSFRLCATPIVALQINLSEVRAVIRAVQNQRNSCCACRYKVDTSPPRNTTYSQAIIAVPKYPPAEELDELLKVQLIFDKFVDEHKDHLSAKNYLALLHRVKGSDAEIVRWQLPPKHHGNTSVQIQRAA